MPAPVRSPAAEASAVHLPPHECLVRAAALHQVIVRAAVLHDALREDGDLVGVAHGGQAVRHHLLMLRSLDYE